MKNTLATVAALAAVMTACHAETFTIDCKCRQALKNGASLACAPGDNISLDVDSGDQTVSGFLLKPRPAEIKPDHITVVFRNADDSSPVAEFHMDRSAGTFTMKLLVTPQEGAGHDFISGLCVEKPLQ